MQLVVFLSDKPYTVVLSVLDELVCAMGKVYIVSDMGGKHWALYHFHSEVG